MRSGAATGRQGYFHEAAFYVSDQAFLDIVVPFLTEGLKAGEPVVSAFVAPHNQALVRDALGTGSGVRFVDGTPQDARPATTIRRYRQMLTEYVAAGAGQIRVAGDVPHAGMGVPGDWWVRYEAAANRAYESFPVWGLCLYDARTVPDEVLEQVRSTHPIVATPTGHLANPSFVQPERFLAGLTSSWRDRLEDSVPLAAFTDPTPAQVRQAITGVGEATLLSKADIDGLLLGATEAVTNAMRHGEPPVAVRIWRSARRIVVAVTDKGPGPSDPFAGLLPATGRSADGGFGLWLAHQLCAYVALDRGSGGFTVRLVGGQPEP